VTSTEDIFVFKKICFSKYHKFVSSAQIKLKLIAVLMKNAPVLLRRYLKFFHLLLIKSGFRSYSNGF